MGGATPATKTPEFTVDRSHYYFLMGYRAAEDVCNFEDKDHVPQVCREELEKTTEEVDQALYPGFLTFRDEHDFLHYHAGVKFSALRHNYPVGNYHFVNLERYKEFLLGRELAVAAKLRKAHQSEEEPQVKRAEIKQLRKRYEELIRKREQLYEEAREDSGCMGTVITEELKIVGWMFRRNHNPQRYLETKYVPGLEESFSMMEMEAEILGIFLYLNERGLEFRIRT